MEKETKCNVCKGSTNLIFSCSGAADVGELADRATRKLTKSGIGKMYCLAGIGGNVQGIIETTKKADKILAIDGCSVECTKKLLESKGFSNFNYIQLEKIGFEKGKTEINDSNVEIVFSEANKLLG